MKKILLVCNLGMSTSMLVQRMESAALKRNIEVQIEAVPFTVAEKVVDEWDIVLLGPQVRHQLAGVKAASNGTTPVELINMRDYGIMDGEKVLSFALDLIEKQ